MLTALFTSENNSLYKNNRIKGILTSVLFHTILIVILYFFAGLTKPYPPIPEGGIMVNLGTSDEGMGDVQPMGVSKDLKIPAPVKSNEAKKIKEEKFVTQDIDDAPVLSKTEKNKTEKKTVTTTNNQQVNNQPAVKDPPKPNPKALYSGGQTNSSTGEGNGTKPGDKGQTNGNPFGTSYTGTPGSGNNPNGKGNGDGFNWSLSGRSMTHPPSINDESQATGKVVIQIKVDKNGNVTYAHGPAQGSTTNDSHLVDLATKAAYQTKFNAASNANEEQFGNITFIFSVK